MLKNLVVAMLFLASIAVQANTNDVNGIQKFRFDDHYAFVNKAEQHEQWPFQLKNIVLSAPRNVVLSAGGEVRQRYEFNSAPAFDALQRDKWGAWLQRYALHADLHIGDRVRVFTQLSSAQESGRKNGPSPVEENSLEFQNAFIDVRLIDNQAAEKHRSLILRAGRQEMEFGSGRLIDTREGTNVRRSFNAVQFLYDYKALAVSGFYARPINSRPHAFDDNSSDQSLWGAYGAIKSTPYLFNTHIDLYYLGFDNNVARFNQDLGSERRYTIGTRIYGERGKLGWNHELMYQFGDFVSATEPSHDILAWSIATEFAYKFSQLQYSPTLKLSANIASGDKDATDNKLQTFNPLYPRGNYFSHAAVLGPRNFFNIHPYIALNLSSTWQVSADMNMFWRLETNDGVYSPSGAILREANNSMERYVGTTISFQSEYQVATNLTFTLIHTHFFAGQFIKSTGPSDDIRFTELSLQYRF